MRVMSTLKTVWTCGLVCLDSTMLRAMMERILVMGTSSPGIGAGAAGFAAAAGAYGTAAYLAAVGFSRWLRMSDLLRRPAEPVPGTWLRSTLLSLAILRTSGDERRRSPDVAAAGVSETGAAATGSAAAGVGAAAFGAGAAAGLPAPPPITATMVLMVTVEPSGNLISVSTPAAGEGISASTLSVEISNSGSSRSTVSPTCFSHLVMVPSVMDSPICGMGTSVPGPEPADAATGGSGAAAGGSAAAGASGAAGVAAAVGAEAEAVPFAPSEMTATTVLIWTVAPSAILISLSVPAARSEEHTSELQSRGHLVCRLLL